MSLGLKGSEVIDPPHPAQLQSPANLGFSPGVTGVASRPSSAGIGSPATPASSGMSKGTSSEDGADSGVGAGVLDLFLLQQSLHVKPVSLRG